MMCIDALHRTATNPNFTALFVTPYENQARLIFGRINELINESPLVAKQVARRTQSPFAIYWKNGSKIIGFTTGASSGNSGASIRGQKADALYLDETDYMADGDFAAVVAIAAERPDISIFLSSTPTGRRSFFYEACVNKDLGYKEFYFPSMANPNWGEEMEAEFRSSLTELQYIHEVLAEFGPQETGVFDKKKLDEAIKMDLYAYDELNYLQERTLDVPIEDIKFFIPEKGERGYYPNKYRTMGVDWDKKALKYKN